MATFSLVVLVGGGLAFLGIVVWIIRHGQKQGRIQERVEAQSEVLDDIGLAKRVREDLDRLDPDARQRVRDQFTRRS